MPNDGSVCHQTGYCAAGWDPCGVGACYPVGVGATCCSTLGTYCEAGYQCVGSIIKGYSCNAIGGVTVSNSSTTPLPATSPSTTPATPDTTPGGTTLLLPATTIGETTVLHPSTTTGAVSVPYHHRRDHRTDLRSYIWFIHCTESHNCGYDCHSSCVDERSCTLALDFLQYIIFRRPADRCLEC